MMVENDEEVEECPIEYAQSFMMEVAIGYLDGVPPMARYEEILICQVWFSNLKTEHPRSSRSVGTSQSNLTSTSHEVQLG